MAVVLALAAGLLVGFGLGALYGWSQGMLDTRHERQ